MPVARPVNTSSSRLSANKGLCLAVFLNALLAGWDAQTQWLNVAYGTEIERCPGWAGAHTELGFGAAKSIVLSAANRKDWINEKDLRNQVVYLRVRLRIRDRGSGRWKIKLKDESFRILQVLVMGDFPQLRSNDSNEHLWSARLNTDFLWLEFETSAPAESAEILVDGLIVMPEEAEKRYYSIQGHTPQWKDLYSPELNNQPVIPGLRRTAESVGLLMGRRDRQTWCCSGVVIASEPEILFLTNFHCGGPNAVSQGQILSSAFYWTDAVCDNTIVDFSWDNDQVSNEFECQSVLHTDPRLDLAVISLVSIQKNPAPNRVRLANADIAGQVAIVHHPECEPKQVSFNCSVIAARRSTGDPGEISPDFTHRCDSEGGSSGAPVFSETGAFLGLHHLGYEVDSNSGSCDNENKAVRVDEILDSLRGNDNLDGFE